MRRRSQIEGWLGSLRSQNADDVRGGWYLVVGLVTTAILAACAIAASRILRARTWADRTDHLCAGDPQRHGFEQLDHEPDTGVTGSTSPPTAA